MCRQPPAPQRFQTLPGARSKEGRYSTDQPATDIADSILTNPWTAALVQDDSVGPQLYCNSTALTRIGLGSWAPDEAAYQKSPGHGQDARIASVDSRDGTAVDLQKQAAKVPENDVCSESSSEHSMHSSGTGSDCGSNRASGSADNQADGETGPQQDGYATDDTGHQHEAVTADSTSGAHPNKLQSKHTAAPQPKSFNPDHCPQPSCTGDACNGSSSHTNGAPVQPAASAGTEHWSAAFTSKHGRQQQGSGPHAAASGIACTEGSGQAGTKPRDYTSWIGDFGHLSGPRFTKQLGIAWQAHMRDQRDQPAVPQDDGELVTQVC